MDYDGWTQGFQNFYKSEDNQSA